MRRVLRIFPFFIVFFILLCCGNVRVDPELPENPEPTENHSSVLYVFPTYLDFGSYETTLTFTIENRGNGTLTWELLKDQKWISCSQEGIPIEEGDTTDETDSVDVEINRTSFKPNECYYGTISVLCNENKDKEDITVAGAQNPSTRQINGYVYYIDENDHEVRVPEAFVWIDAEQWTDAEHKCFSGPDGRYAISDVPTNGFTVYAFKEGFLPYKSDKQLADTEDVWLPIQLHEDN